VIGCPLFPDILVKRPGGAIHIVAEGAAADAPYVHALSVNGRAISRPWLDEGFVRRGGELRFSLSATPDEVWGTAPDDAPPSYGPR
jgi:putative alpha-1,2-mannosidase